MDIKNSLSTLVSLIKEKDPTAQRKLLLQIADHPPAFVAEFFTISMSYIPRELMFECLGRDLEDYVWKLVLSGLDSEFLNGFMGNIAAGDLYSEIMDSLLARMMNHLISFYSKGTHGKSGLDIADGQAGLDRIEASGNHQIHWKLLQFLLQRHYRSFHLPLIHRLLYHAFRRPDFYNNTKLHESFRIYELYLKNLHGFKESFDLDLCFLEGLSLYFEKMTSVDSEPSGIEQTLNANKEKLDYFGHLLSEIAQSVVNDHHKGYLKHSLWKLLKFNRIYVLNQSLLTGIISLLNLYTIDRQVELESVFSLIEKLLTCQVKVKILNLVRQFISQQSLEYRLAMVKAMTARLVDDLLSTRNGCKALFRKLAFISFYNDENLKELYRHQLEIIYNAIPPRILDLNAKDCLSLVSNLEVILLEINSMGILELYSQEELVSYAEIISKTVLNNQDINLSSKEWQTAVLKTPSGILGTVSSSEITMLLKTITILPATKSQFHILASITDIVKSKSDANVHSNMFLLFKSLWSKHHSLEHFVNYMIVNLNNLESVCAELLENACCIESKEGKVVPAEESEEDTSVEFRFRINCQHRMKIESEYLLKAWQKMWDAKRDQCKVKLVRCLIVLLMHTDMVFDLREWLDYVVPILYDSQIDFCLQTELLKLFYQSTGKIDRVQINWEASEVEFVKRLNGEKNESEMTVRHLGVLVNLHANVDWNPSVFLSAFKLLLAHGSSQKGVASSLILVQLLEIPKRNYFCYLKEISIWAVQQFVTNRKILQNLSQLMRLSMVELIEQTLKYTLPELIKSRDLNMIKELILKGKLDDHIKIGRKLVENSGYIFSSIFVYQNQEALDYYVQLVNDCLRHDDVVTVESLLKTNLLQLVGLLVIDMGSDSRLVCEKALQGLTFVSKNVGAELGQYSLDHFLLHFALGILTRMQSIILDPENIVSSEEKHKTVGGLISMIRLISQSCSSISPQILGLLQIILQKKDLMDLGLDAWTIFVKSLPIELLRDIFVQISLILVETHRKCTAEQSQKIIDMFHYLIIENYNNLKPLFASIAHNIPESVEWKEIKDTISQFYPKEKSLLSRLVDISALLFHENSTVVNQSLVKLKSLLDIKCFEVQELLLSETIDLSLKRLVKQLFLTIRKYHASNQSISILACECLGIIGAVDPSRMDISLEGDKMFGVGLDLSSPESVLVFAIKLVEVYFCPLFRATQDPGLRNTLAFTIQEILQWCGYTPELVSQASKSATSNRANVGGSILIEKWNRFSKTVLQTIEPLIGSKYHIPALKINPLQYPIFEKVDSYNDWIISWALNLLPMLKNQKVYSLFQKCELVIASELNIAQLLLPQLLLNVLAGAELATIKNIREEFIFVLNVVVTSASERERVHLSIQTIFMLMDHLQNWSRVIKTKIGISKDQRMSNSLQEELKKVKYFLSEIPQELLTRAAISCHSYERALMYFEDYIVTNKILNTDGAQSSLAQLQKIYALLGDSDALDGIATLLLTPTLEQQIIQHEVCGRWPAAQSCYEVLLQQQPEESAYQLGLLKCLQNMGHYQSMITYSQGMQASVKMEQNSLAPLVISATWRLGDWKNLEIYLANAKSFDFESLLGKLLLLLNQGRFEKYEGLMTEMKLTLANLVSATSMESYSQAYDSILQSSMLEDVERIRKLMVDGSSIEQNLQKLFQIWDKKVHAMKPVFKARESVLNLRRILLSLPKGVDELASELTANLWIRTAKEARKTGYYQTAYSSILQALNYNPVLARVERSKWLWAQNLQHEALVDLKGISHRDMKTFAKVSPNGTLCLPSGTKTEAKANLRLASWMETTNGLHSSNIMAAYIQINRETPQWEKSSFMLGRYYNRFLEADSVKKELKDSSNSAYNANIAYLICKQYGKSLAYGTKYLYQSLPRMLTLWLDMGAAVVEMESDRQQHAELEKVKDKLSQTTTMIKRYAQRLPNYQFLTAMSQLTSRICHKNLEVQDALEGIIVSVLSLYPQQSLWHLMAVAKSTVKTRVSRVSAIFSKVKFDPNSRKVDPHLIQKIQLAEMMTDQLLNLCNYKVSKDTKTLSMPRDFRKLQKIVAGDYSMIIPLQSSLSVTLPTTASANHKPFKSNLPLIAGFKDNIEVLNSLQKPKKITILGSDGNEYVFLGKPEDDLRKDSRLMEFNAIINKLLKKDTEARKRKLFIKTYAVIPLNEKCGLIQWVKNNMGLRIILSKYYRARNITSGFHEIKAILDQNKQNPTELFVKKVLPMHPPVFRDWFYERFTEPTQWMTSRNNYTSTVATMSMVGYVVGLGDRHGENILFDEGTGECLHVDLNCLFEKGLEFDIPERVPFRLTHNMVDAFGVYGVEGPFRKCCEVTMSVLHANRELLMSVLETFLHDPLCEWSSPKHAGEGENAKAVSSLCAIDRKLQGYVTTARLPLSVQGQVEELLNQATNPENLARMYIGWAPYL